MARIRRLLAERNLRLDQYLDLKKLSYDTGVSTETVAALLAGRATAESRETDTREIARHRFRFLHATRTGPTGDPYTAREIADAINVTREWVRLLLGKDQKKIPSLEVAKPLARFFGEEITFLTDTASEALNKQLHRIVESLESPSSTDPMERLISEYGLQGVSARSTDLTDRQKHVLAGMIMGMITSNDAEGRG
ncbi:hypothetical protein [Streptomyces sp. NPDC097619]|uniref:hypothetical protein n=1 Tax=Streptomyces sp. NPDC097619 TaxID=3157228 RepID=UPI0033306686